MQKKLIATLIAAPFLIVNPIWADDITDQIQTALTAYEDKDYRTAVDELKFVTAQLEKLKNEQNQTLLPDPLDGWKVEAGDNADSQMAMAMMGGGSSMKATYLREKETVEIEVLANSPLLSMMTMMINNPMMMASDKNIKPFRYKKSKGMKKTDGNTTEITLVLAGQIMVKVTGENLKDEAILEQYLDAIDMAKLKEALL